jgi:hypothetical protein
MPLEGFKQKNVIIVSLKDESFDPQNQEGGRERGRKKEGMESLWQYANGFIKTQCTYTNLKYL